MKFLLKIIFMITIAGGIFTKAMEAKQTIANNHAVFGMPSDLAAITNVIQSSLHIAQPKQSEKTVIKRVCKIKPNGDEECRNITTE
ncbi:MAG: hypothetical protein ACXWF8_01730 [Methylobacter sp.]